MNKKIFYLFILTVDKKIKTLANVCNKNNVKKNIYIIYTYMCT